jgi:hypothetical protein
MTGGVAQAPISDSCIRALNYSRGQKEKLSCHIGNRLTCGQKGKLLSFIWHVPRGTRGSIPRQNFAFMHGYQSVDPFNTCSLLLNQLKISVAVLCDNNG